MNATHPSVVSKSYSGSLSELVSSCAGATSFAGLLLLACSAEAGAADVSCGSSFAFLARDRSSFIKSVTAFCVASSSSTSSTFSLVFQEPRFPPL